MTLHQDPRVRQASVQAFLKDHKLKNTDRNAEGFAKNDKCYSKGIDQGIHNWLLRSGDVFHGATVSF